MTEQERRIQILQAARHVFAKHGYHKASIKMIAKEAGIKSAALIYHYFADKKALLEAIVREMTPLGQLPPMQADAPLAILDIPPELLLPHMLPQVLAMADDPETEQLLKIFLSEAMRLPEVGEAVRGLQSSVLQFLVRYIEHHISLGNLRPHNAETSARALVGMVIVNVLGVHIFPAIGETMPARDVYVREIVEIFLGGIRSES